MSGAPSELVKGRTHNNYQYVYKFSLQSIALFEVHNSQELNFCKSFIYMFIYKTE